MCDSDESACRIETLGVRNITVDDDIENNESETEAELKNTRKMMILTSKTMMIKSIVTLLKYHNLANSVL